MTHPALTSQSVATITGGAAGIGLAAARRFAAMGMRIAIADNRAELLSAAADELMSLGAPTVITSQADVSDRAQ